MNQEQYEKVKAAAKWWRDEGGRIIDDIWSYVDCRCPLGAFCEFNKSAPAPGFAAELLDVGLSPIDAFTCGFDGEENYRPTYDDWHAAGVRMRAELEAEGVLMGTSVNAAIDDDA